MVKLLRKKGQNCYLIYRANKIKKTYRINNKTSNQI